MCVSQLCVCIDGRCECRELNGIELVGLLLGDFSSVGTANSIFALFICSLLQPFVVASLLSVKCNISACVQYVLCAIQEGVEQEKDNTKRT